jgi:hypothetical protein
MSLSEAARMVETARAELERTRSDTAGWSDELRQRFDAQRFKPLTDAATKMAVALKKAQEQFDAAQRMIDR